MRFVSFLQRLGYLVFLQVLLLPCLAYSTFHVSLGHNFGFSFASFCYCCSYTYFILVGPFCFGLFVFHSAPGADFVWNKIFLFVPAVRDRSSPGSPPRFSSLFNVKSLGFKVVTVPASLGANGLMFTVRLIAIDVAYQGISPGLVAANAAAETLGVGK